MPRFKDQAICIRLIDWSETSQIVTLLTCEHGKIRGVAKGSKRTSPSHMARFSGGIELLTLGETVASTKPSAELATLTEWDLQKPFWALRRNLPAQRLALYAADLANAFVSEEDPHPVVFDELEAFLQALCEKPPTPPEVAADPEASVAAALLRYQWRLLADCGYKPELERDVLTGQALPALAIYQFDARAGGFTGEESTGNQPAPARWPVREQTLGLLNRVAAGAMLADVPAEALQRTNRLLCVYARDLLGRQLPTMRFVLGE